MLPWRFGLLSAAPRWHRPPSSHPRVRLAMAPLPLVLAVLQEHLYAQSVPVGRMTCASGHLALGVAVPTTLDGNSVSSRLSSPTDALRRCRRRLPVHATFNGRATAALFTRVDLRVPAFRRGRLCITQIADVIGSKLPRQVSMATRGRLRRTADERSVPGRAAAPGAMNFED